MEDRATLYGAEALEAERWLVSCGFESPALMCGAARQHHVTEASIHDPTMAYLFGLLCEAAELGHVLSADDAIRMAKRVEFPLPLGIYNWMADLLALEGGLGGIGVDRYAAMVAKNHNVRLRYRALMAEAEALLPDGDTYPIRIPQPRQPALRHRRVVA